MAFKDIFSIKYGALLLLVLQNTFLVILMRVSRSHGGPMYSSASAVAVMEIVKFIACGSVITYQNGGFGGFVKVVYDEVVLTPFEIVKLSVPSIIYVVQNNLLYYALTHLDAATYMVGYQMKILTTAVFATFLLGKKLSILQWISLIMLTVGVSLAQLHASSSPTTNTQASDQANKDIVETHHVILHRNSTSGFIAVLLAACTSGFSGIYFEKVLKGSTTTVWMRNIQMGITSITIAFTTAFTTDYTFINQHGFLYGYTATVWMVIILQALGGLVVAVVIKYADNILKGFAASFSIITACIICYFFLDFQPSLAFMIGATLVLGSSYMYEKGLPPQLYFIKKKAMAMGIILDEPFTLNRTAVLPSKMTSDEKV